MDKADAYIAEAGNHIATGDNATVWTNYRTSMYKYKLAVRATTKVSGFPAKAEYPAMPEQP